ncbi:MAG: cytochrome c oxidase subunit II [Bacteroidota bacterium]|nr:cytochrome c oxidase subunit II [Bacteroidota bacterium]
MRPSIVDEVDFTFWFIAGISIVLLLIITGAMLYFVYKYSKKRHPVASDIEGNTTIEIIWTVIPIILVLLMFFVSWSGFKNMRDVPKDAMVVTVTGQMWKWTFDYDNKKKSDTLFLPVNKDIKFDIKSQDVNHSFYLPAFRVKEDAIPGRTNYYWIRTTETGNFYASCAEYCGLNHSYMYAAVVIMPEDKFLVWKSYFPPDTTKIELPTTIIDTIKTNPAKTDSAGAGSNNNINNNIDTTRKNAPPPDMKKPDTLKK